MKKKKKSLQHKVFFQNKKPDQSVCCCTDIRCTEFSYRIFTLCVVFFFFFIKSQCSGVKPNTNLSQTPELTVNSLEVSGYHSCMAPQPPK